MINAAIIDDEFSQRQVIKSLIKSKYDNINIVAETDKVEGAGEIILKHNPDLVFMDVELPDGTSFDILKQLTSINFKIIFITGFKDYAIEAFKFSALDYILKPLKSAEFFDAVNKAINEISIHNQLLKIENLINNLQNNPKENRKIVLKTQESIYLVNIYDIIKCESDNAYITFYTRDNRKIIVSGSLSYYEELLTQFGFFRVHQSYLINLNFIEKFDKREGGFIVLSDNSQIPIAQRKRQQFFEIIEKMGI